MSADTPGPQPARLIFLDQLPDQTLQAKVRFLGCIRGSSYDSELSTLMLVHSRDPSARISAQVDISLVADSLTGSDTQEGAWVNVIGVVSRAGRIRRGIMVQVQAMMVWSAGALNIQRYEQALEEMQCLSSEA